MSVKLLTEHYLEFLCLNGGCTGSSESTLVKQPHCWKSHVAAHMVTQCVNVNAVTSLALYMLPYICSIPKPTLRDIEYFLLTSMV